MKLRKHFVIKIEDETETAEFTFRYANQRDELEMIKRFKDNKDDSLGFGSEYMAFILEHLEEVKGLYYSDETPLSVQDIRDLAAPRYFYDILIEKWREANNLTAEKDAEKKN